MVRPAANVALIALAAMFIASESRNCRGQGASSWRAPTGDDAANRYGAGGAPQVQAQPLPGATPTTPTAAERPARAQVSKGSGALPNDQGQVWREYDISPYTIRNTATAHPEQAIVDWTLRETGYEAWHATPVGLLSADRKVLRVYHTPQMQAIVAEIVDRFVSGPAQNYGFGLRVITMKNPNWRIRALPLMTSIPVQSPGVQGWILAKEDAALLLAEFRRRTDYREQTTPNQMVLNGQTTVISTMRPITYTKGIIPTQAVWPGYQPELGQLDEGFSLEFSPLLSTDARTTDAVVKLKLCQVERMLEVQLEAPSQVAQNQRAAIQVPQLTMVQLHERFRWPTDHVLLLSMGVVATPGPEKANVITDMLPLPKSAPRSDALLMVESTGTVTQAAPAGGAVGAGGPAVETAGLPTFHGRY
jgi:hypothetical protein